LLAFFAGFPGFSGLRLAFSAILGTWDGQRLYQAISGISLEIAPFLDFSRKLLLTTSVRCIAIKQEFIVARQGGLRWLC